MSIQKSFPFVTSKRELFQSYPNLSDLYWGVLKESNLVNFLKFGARTRKRKEKGVEEFTRIDYDYLIIRYNRVVIHKVLREWCDGR